MCWQVYRTDMVDVMTFNINTHLVDRLCYSVIFIFLFVRLFRRIYSLFIWYHPSVLYFSFFSPIIIWFKILDLVIHISLLTLSFFFSVFSNFSTSGSHHWENIVFFSVLEQKGAFYFKEDNAVSRKSFDSSLIIFNKCDILRLLVYFLKKKILYNALSLSRMFEGFDRIVTGFNWNKW